MLHQTLPEGALFVLRTRSIAELSDVFPDGIRSDV